MTKKDTNISINTNDVGNNEAQLKVVFQPGCFDHLEVESQEELDAIVAEIQTMLANITPEELHAMSRPVTEETLAEMAPEEREALLKALEQADDQETRSRRLN